MALITPQPRIERDKIAVRLDRDTVTQLRLYAEWLKSSQEWVINRALEHLFARDKDFQAHLRATPRRPRTQAVVEGSDRTRSTSARGPEADAPPEEQA